MQPPPRGLAQSPRYQQVPFYPSRLSVFTFLEDKATALTYFTATAGQSVIASKLQLKQTHTR